MTKESLNDSLFELNTLILDLRSKLSKSLQEVLKLRKDLDLEKEEHQLTELKYQSMKDIVTNKLVSGSYIKMIAIRFCAFFK